MRRAGAASKVPFLPTLFEVESVPWVGEAFLYPYDSSALAKVRRNTVIKYRGESLPGAAYRAVTSIVSKTVPTSRKSSTCMETPTRLWS